MTDWVRDYIGQPWIYGEHDCWAFFRKVQKERFGRDVPIIDVNAFNTLECVRAFVGHEERANWIEIPNTQQAKDGDAVLMSQSKRPTHVGVWVNGAVLHCVRNTGVVYTNEKNLKSFPYNITGIYRAR